MLRRPTAAEALKVEGCYLLHGSNPAAGCVIDSQGMHKWQAGCLVAVCRLMRGDLSLDRFLLLTRHLQQKECLCLLQEDLHWLVQVTLIQLCGKSCCRLPVRWRGACWA